MAETLDRMILVIRAAFRRMEFDLHETTHVGILGRIGELHIRQIQHRRARRDHTIFPSGHARVHLRAGGQRAQQRQHVLIHGARLVIKGEGLAVHLVVHGLAAQRVDAAIAVLLHAETGKHLADAQHADQRLTCDQSLAIAAVTGQHVGQLFERFEPWRGEHAAQVRIGFLIHGQPSEDAFRLLQRLDAHADRSERLRDGDVGHALQADDLPVAAHPYARVAADAAFHLVEPLGAFRFAEDRRTVERIAFPAVGRGSDMVFVLDGFYRMPAVEQEAVSVVVAHVGVASPEPVL